MKAGSELLIIKMVHHGVQKISDRVVQAANINIFLGGYTVLSYLHAFFLIHDFFLIIIFFFSTVINAFTVYPPLSPSIMIDRDNYNFFFPYYLIRFLELFLDPRICCTNLFF